MRRLLLFGLVVATIILVPAHAVLACSCSALPLGDPIELAGHAQPAYDQAFVGTATSVGARAATFSVETSLTGSQPRTVKVLQPTSDCGTDFERGRRYLVEGHRNADGTLATSACTFTQLWETAGTLPDESGPPGTNWVRVAAIAAVSLGLLGVTGPLVVARRAKVRQANEAKRGTDGG